MVARLAVVEAAGGITEGGDKRPHLAISQDLMILWNHGDGTATSVVPLPGNSFSGRSIFSRSSTLSDKCAMAAE
jgi:hypothetical protein